jgi:hypothetical protein
MGIFPEREPLTRYEWLSNSAALLLFAAGVTLNIVVEPAWNGQGLAACGVVGMAATALYRRIRAWRA